MNDFFADLEQDLVDATTRANKGTRRSWLPILPRLRLAPVLAFAATAAVLVAIVSLAGGGSGTDDERAAQPQPPQQQDDGRGAGDFDHDKGQEEERCASHVLTDVPPAAAEYFPIFAREQNQDDRSMPEVRPQGNLLSYHSLTTRFLGGGAGHKYYAFAAMVGTCEKPEEGVCLVAASPDDTQFACAPIAEARRGGVRQIVGDYVIGLAPGDAQVAVYGDGDAFEVRNNFYRGDHGGMGEGALSSDVDFE